MKYLILVLLFVSSPLWALTPLTKASVQSALDLSQQIDSLEDRFPEVIQRLQQEDENTELNKTALIAYLEKSDAYPTIKSFLSNSEFNNLKDLYDFSDRLFSSITYVQLEGQSDAEFNLNDIEKMIKASIESMKSTGAPVQVIAEMENDLLEHQANMKAMKAYAESSKPEDRNFVKNNFQWIIDSMPEDE